VRNRTIAAVDERSLSRRRFLGRAVAIGALGCAGSWLEPRVAMAQGQGLPERGEYLIRHAFVMTMDAGLGDMANADVHLRGGDILAVGRDIDAPRAQILDGTDMIVLPGLIETHWHVWTTLLRSMSGDVPGQGYFPTSQGIGAFYLADDMYRGGRLALAEAIHSGITFVHDWCHNVRSPEFARAALSALVETGIRGRFGYGSAAGQAGDAMIDVEDLAQLAESWETYADGGRLSLGLAWRGVGSEASLRDYAAARELDLPVSVHVNNSRNNAGRIAAIAEAGLLGPHVQLIHAVWSTPEEIRAVARSGATLSVSPYTELRIGFGFPMTGEYLDAGVPIGLSVDTPALSGNADMFAIMKAIQNIENARALDEFKLSARRVLELATIEGARSMGVADRVGSLVPGKRADLIMLDTRHINLGVFTDPAHMLVEAAQPANVDTVIADGRILKRGGRLTAIDTDEVVEAARAALRGVRQRADWP
jgi:5-methylthioadenosine/S-adenosylhomocysteine deaminase